MPRRGFIPKREVLADPIYKSVVVTKVVVADGGLDKSEINTTCYFALWDREAGSYVQRNGKTWIESIDIVKSSMGEVSGNTVTNLKLIAQSRNIVELEFADNMKHAIKLTAYEFK